MEKLDNFYRTRADFPDWMTEEEWNKKEIEIIKDALSRRFHNRWKVCCKA